LFSFSGEISDESSKSDNESESKEEKLALKEVESSSTEDELPDSSGWFRIADSTKCLVVVKTFLLALDDHKINSLSLSYCLSQQF
jgi:hypothetical protein